MMTRGSAMILMIGYCSLAHAYEPTRVYEKLSVAGFTVLVHPEVRKHPTEADLALEELQQQLTRIGKVVPKKPLSMLYTVPIWLEWAAKPGGAAEFHVAASWLKDNGYNPEKHQAIEINNTRNFIAWSRQNQPWMLFHELAHAYHFRVLGENHPGLQAAYRQAMERKLYDTVARVGAKPQRAYAASSPAEYFAELSEAYFGRNDFFPFTHDDLKNHDPIGYRLMIQTWGEPLR
jgi:hypothetical protein